MNRPRLASLLSLCAVVLASGASAVQMMAQQLPPNTTVYAAGLEGPRGLAFGPDGSLYVAEAGLGGTTSTVGTCAQVPAPIGPYTGGLTARISKIDTNGKITTVVSGLPSAHDAQTDLLGVADVTFLNGNLYAVLAGGGCSHGNTAFPNAILRVNLKNGTWTSVANLSEALVKFPAQFTSSDDYEPDGTWYGMITEDGLLYTVEPNHGQVFSVAPGGKVRQIIDISASQGHIVPTSLVFDQDVMYVGNLNLFPIDPQWAKVMTIAQNVYVPNPLPGFSKWGDLIDKWNIVSSKAGFTTITSMKVGPDGCSMCSSFPMPQDFPRREQARSSEWTARATLKMWSRGWLCRQG